MSFGKKSQQQVTFQTVSQEQNQRKTQNQNDLSSEREENEMSKPYWERKNFHSYKQIKVLQPALETPVLEYIDIKIKE